jgi:predicted alpha/beta-hydrolase family hydrolase
MRHWLGLLGEFGDARTFAWFDAEERPPFDVLVDFHLKQLEECWAGYERVVLVGKSLGAWTSCGVAARAEVDAVICLGYPLAEPENSDSVRHGPLVELPVPGLVVFGSEDSLCPRAMLELAVARNSKLVAHCVSNGDHSLNTDGGAGAQEHAEREICAAIGALLDGVCGSPRTSH